MDYRNYEFPLKVKYVRQENRVYFATDFEDGEEITYVGKCEKPSSNALGYRWYKGRTEMNLVHISEIVGCE